MNDDDPLVLIMLAIAWAILLSAPRPWWMYVYFGVATVIFAGVPLVAVLRRAR